MIPIQTGFNAGVEAFQRASSLADQSAQNIARETVRSEQQNVYHAATPQPVATDNPAVEPTSAQTFKAVTPAVEITEELINQRVAERQAQAAVKVIETADSLTGTLIDTTA